MPYVANLTTAMGLRGQLVGNGQCVSFVHAVTLIPPASLWHRGEAVKGSGTIQPGTVIATFDPDGRYGNHTDGRSHAAVYLGQDAHGIRVLDQWNGHTRQPVHERVLRFRHGQGAMVNDGDQFYVVR